MRTAFALCLLFWVAAAILAARHFELNQTEITVIRSLICIAACAGMFAAAAFAQSAPSQPATYTLTLPAASVDQVGAGILELPAKIANPLLNDISAQVKAQNDAFAKAHAPTEVPTPEPKPKK